MGLSLQDKKEVIEFLGKKFGIKPNQSWGTLTDKDLQTFWHNNNGDTLYNPPPAPGTIQPVPVPLQPPSYHLPVHTYLSNWGWESTPPNIEQLKLVDVVINSFWSLDSKGAIKGRNKTQEKALRALKHPRIYAAIGGWGSTSPFSKLWGNPSSRLESVLLIGKAITDCGWHGLDVDWEYPNSTQKKQTLVAFLRDFRQYWPLLDLSIAVGAEPENVAGFAADLSGCVDWMHVMTYDFVGYWTNTSGHHSDLASGANILTRLSESGMLRSKLMLGSAWYGKRMAGCTAPNQKVAHWEDIEFSSILSLPEKEWIVESGLGCDWLSNSTLNQCITYESARAVREKVAWVKAQGFGGIFCWEWTQDSPSAVLANAMLSN